MEAVKKRWPGMLVQFEDFNTELAFELLDIWRDKQTCFNDDVRPVSSGLTVRSKVPLLLSSAVSSMQFVVLE